MVVGQHSEHFYHLHPFIITHTLPGVRGCSQTPFTHGGVIYTIYTGMELGLGLVVGYHLHHLY